jgi:hypothetical protein
MIGTLEGVSIQNGRMVTRGQARELAWGFSFFKGFNYVAQHFNGDGDSFESWGDRKIKGTLNIVKAFVADRQALVGRDDVWFRIFTQTGEGEPGSWELKSSIDQGMFGAPPHEPNPDRSNARLWDYDALRRGERPEGVTPLMAKVLEWYFQYSQEGGACFELVVDATIKQMDDMRPGTVDHMVRQMAAKCRDLQSRFPRACCILSTDNEWDAHNKIDTTLHDVNMRAKRFYRWKDESGALSQSFAHPGGTFEPEQWPEGIVIVDHGGKDFFQYEVGPEPDRFKMAALHPGRKGGERDWRDISPIMARLKADSRGMPIAFTESMYYVDDSPESLERAGRIYNANGWHADAEDMMTFYKRWAGKINYGIIHTEKDVQGMVDWPMERTPLEKKLAEFFGTGAGEPLTPPGEDKVSYRHIVESLFDEILDRKGDPAGLKFYDEQMRLYYRESPELGLSYENVRDAMLRSEEFAARFRG